MSLLKRIREARLIRVILVYLGASWVVVEVADLLQDALGLPDWVVPVTIILLLAGLVVVSATAWVQSQPATDRREAAGEVPRDWELDLPDLARSFKRGQIPHLTWTRALLGGAGAFLAMFVLAILVVLGPGESASVGPAARTGEAAGPGLAVLPFRVSGEELATWQEGMVDLLSRNLDGIGGLRAIDSRTVLARWAETVGSGTTPDLATTLEAAHRTGARWALVGSAVEVGRQVRVSADLHDVETGRRIEGVTVEGSPDSLFALVDGLSVEVARDLLRQSDPDLSGLRLSSITTSSPDALRAFLEGEADYRHSRFRAAAREFERAVEGDAGFALAWYRLAAARGWLGDEAAAEARLEAYEHRDRLPDREALMVEADYRSRRGALTSGVELLREGVRRYPDDPEMWYQLGDVYLHFGLQLLVSRDEARRALERAVELDPGFAPYLIHLVDLALVRGDSAAAARWVAREAEAASHETREVRAHRLQLAYLYGAPGDRKRILAALDTLDPAVGSWLRTPFSLEGEKAADLLALANAACERLLEDMPPDGAVRWTCLRTLMTAGRIEEARHYSDAMKERGLIVIPALADLALRRSGMDPSAPLADPRPILAISFPDAGVVPPVYVAAGVVAAARGEEAIVDSVSGTLAAIATAREQEGDTLTARIIRGLREGVEGHRALSQGKTDAAIDHLERAHRLIAGGSGPEIAFLTHVTWSLAELYAQEGRDREALRYFASLWQSFYAAPALLRRADLHERLAEEDRARELRREFLALWANGDPGNPLIQAARRGLPPG